MSKPMNKHTKVNVRKILIEEIKIKAAADNRTITNYIETLILKDLAPKLKESLDESR